MTVTIEITGIEETLKALGRYEGIQSLRPAMLDAVEVVRDHIAAYPPRPALGGNWVAQMTPKARGWFFANLRAGTIQVPYRRTGTLGRKWLAKVATGTELVGTVGNWLPYAHFVQNRETQANIHRDRWATVQDVAESKWIGRVIQAIFDRHIRKIFG